MKKCSLLLLVCLFSAIFSTSVFADTLDTANYYQIGFYDLALHNSESGNLYIYCDGWVLAVHGDETNTSHNYAIRYNNDDNRWVYGAPAWAILSDLSERLSTHYGWTTDEINKLKQLNFFWDAYGILPVPDNELYLIHPDLNLGNNNVNTDAAGTMAWIINNQKDLFLNDSNWTSDGKYKPNAGDTDNENNLSPLSFSYSKKWYAKLANDFWRYSLVTKWDYKEKEPYISEPDKYKVQIIAFLNGHNSDYQKMSDVNTWYWVTKGQSVAANEYQFSLEDTVNNIRKKFNYPAVTENILLNVYIRTYDPVSGKVSKWCGVTIQDPCGAPIIRPTVYPDGYDGSDNNVDTEADPPIDNGGYESGGEDDSRSDPNSDNYVDPSTLQGIDSIIANLKSLAIAVGTIPSLLNDVYLWLPSDLIVLISSSIGLVVLIGVIKWAR